MSVAMRSVSDSYESKSVLITGSTGSLGKMLMEKLLRCCSGIKNIYLLVRPMEHSGLGISERLSDLMNLPLFSKLHEEGTDVFKKIIVIQGDLQLPNIGISEDDRISLINNISVVFHCAALMKFDADLKDSISTNVFGTRRLLQLCQQMKKIEAFIYVSTLYSTCNSVIIEERVPALALLNELNNWNELDEDELVRLIPSDFVNQWPNTYTFSKAVAEIMLDKYKHWFSISIVRPSIILSTMREPMPGWIDNFYGPTLMICNSALGLKRSLYGNLKAVANFIPADLVVNLMICTGWKTLREKSLNIKIYNCCSGKQNPITWGQFGQECLKSTKKYPFKKMIRYPHTSYLTSFYAYQILTAIQEYLVAFIYAIAVDSQILQIQKRQARIWDLVRYFTNREWTIDDHNVMDLNNQLSEIDKERFCIDSGRIDWSEYFESYVKGIRVHLAKDNMNTLDESRARLHGLYWREILLQLFLAFVIIAPVYTIERLDIRMKTEDIFADGYYKRNRIFMALVGLWPEYPKEQRIILQCFSLLSLLSIIIPEYGFLIKVCDNVDDLIFSFVEQMTISVALVYYYFFIKNMERIHLTINQIREDWRILEETPAFETLRTYAERGYLATSFYAFVIFTTAMIYNLFPLNPVVLDLMFPLNQSRPRINILKADYSIYGIDVDKYYFIICFHAMWNVVLLLLFVVAVDTFIMLIIEHCCGLFEAVGDILRQLRADTTPQRQHEIVCGAIEIHHRALTFVESIESTFTMMYGFVVLVSMILVSLTGVEIIAKMDDPAELLRFAVCGGGQVVHLFFVSIPGQEIHDHSSRVSEEAYNCNWLELSLETRKLIYIILMRSIKPVHLTAGRFYIQCMESFGHVLKTSFSFFTVMLSSR